MKLFRLPRQAARGQRNKRSELKHFSIKTTMIDTEHPYTSGGMITDAFAFHFKSLSESCSFHLPLIEIKSLHEAYCR